MVEFKKYNPDGIAKPRSPYCHVNEVKGASKLVFLAGQVPLDQAGNVVGADDFEKQCTQVYANIETALKAAGAEWKHVVQLTSILVRAEDIEKFGAYRQREFPQLFPNGAYPPNTLMIISRLANPAFRIEVQAVAAL
ncbi:MAG: RidA family protein [Xanthobacteraceae bacterium]|nr:RidA family protein [Xanthobacteraceae bacterium]